MNTVNERTPEPLKVAVTGAAGQIDYSLLPRLASGETFGPKTQVELRLLETPGAMKALDGVIMELRDCAFPLLSDIVKTDDPNVAFDGANFAIMVGAAPRGKGMQRDDLLKVNAPIFQEQGKALLKAAADIQTLVVGNPANTNTLIAWANAQDIPKERFFALMLLDELRAKAQLKEKINLKDGGNFNLSDISNMVVWGNHSASQYPDFYNALIDSASVLSIINDVIWLQTEFILNNAKRGSEIIEARGKSSALSAANAIVENLKRLTNPTLDNDCFTMGGFGNGEYPNIPDDLVFGRPYRLTNERILQVIPGFNIDEPFSKMRIQENIEELSKEKEIIEDFL